MVQYVFFKDYIIRKTMIIHFVSKISTNNACQKKYIKYTHVQIKNLYPGKFLCVW